MNQDGNQTAKLTPEMEALMAQFQAQMGQMTQELRAEIAGLRSGTTASGETTSMETPTKAVTFNDLGVQLFYRNELSDACTHLQKAADLDPNLLEAWNNLAMVYSALGESEKAAEAFGKAVELDPDRTEVANNSAVLRMLSGDGEGALAVLEQASQTNPRHIPILLNLGQAYQAKGEHERAVRAWKMVTVIDPGNEEARQNLRRYFQ